MLTIFKYFNNIFNRKNKVNIETIVENKELKEEKIDVLESKESEKNNNTENTELQGKKIDILKTIFDLKVLSESQLKLFTPFLI
jgi:hypothetical protein